MKTRMDILWHKVQKVFLSLDQYAAICIPIGLIKFVFLQGQYSYGVIFSSPVQ